MAHMHLAGYGTLVCDTSRSPKDDKYISRLSDHYTHSLSLGITTNLDNFNKTTRHPMLRAVSDWFQKLCSDLIHFHWSSKFSGMSTIGQI
ncbi:hypothetical protein TNCV_2459601 [Trichonephila clavipes]|nr:hypothetical protein TNCV_2459601 [Trichonephila clavipes]